MLEFQFFDGCPNSAKTLTNLMELVEEKFLEETDVKITEIHDPEEAERGKFQGSPTILVCGVDIYTGEVPRSSSFSCRTYVFDGNRSGILSKEFIKAKYLEFNSGEKIQRKHQNNVS
jgi:hypothetical protein